jgi:dienelactone hydrolase
MIGIPVTDPAPVVLSAELYTPKRTAPHPAVILMHGCGGIGKNVPAWAMWLASEGYAALLVDSFSARGVRSLCGDSSPLPPTVRAGDVPGAVAALRSMSAIDPNRIALMGLSNGGSTALAARRDADRYPDARLRAIIAFYPGCGSRLAPASAPPLLILIGERDDWSSPDACKKLAESARQAGRDLTLVLYPGAAHHFDGAEVRGRVHVSAARGGKGATIEYNPAAHADSESQVKRFLAEHLKP